MAETTETASTETKPASTANPFAEEAWSNEPIQPTKVAEEEIKIETKEAPTVTETAPATTAATIATTTTTTKEEAPATQAEIKTAEPLLKFANADSEKVFNLIKDGKVDDVYDYLEKNRKLSKTNSLDLSKPSEAAELLKVNLQLKYKDLAPDEIEYLFERDYAIPKKPEQGLDQTDDEYQQQLQGWQQQVDAVNKKLTIDAKLAKPELAKYQSELVLPDIPKAETQPTTESQEDLANREKLRNLYTQTLDAEYKNFNGISATFKDKDVEYAVAFAPTEEEKTQLKSKLQDFDINEYFGSRWFDSEGKPKTSLMMADLYRLENGDKIDQKFVMDSASKRLDVHINAQKNITINNGNSNVPRETLEGEEASEASELDKMRERAFSV